MNANVVLVLITAIALFAQLALPMAAQQLRYTSIDVGALGGRDGNNLINAPKNRGELTDWSEPPKPDPLVPVCLYEACKVVPHFLTAKAVFATGGVATTPVEADTSLTITSGYPPSGRVGKLYDLRCPLPCFGLFLAGFPVTATGGVRPYSWSWAAQQGSSLPLGLIFPDISGYQCLHIRPPAICGKPLRAGSYNVVVTVKDSESPPHHTSKSYTIHIFPQ